MSGGNSGSNKNTEALVKAFPQLGGGNENRTARGAGAEPNLHAVPAPQQPGTAVAVPGGRPGLEKFWNVPVTVSFEVGRQDITVKQLMSLTRGSIIPMKNVFVDSIKMKVGDRTLARAEAIGLKKNYGIRISEVTVPPGVESEDS